MRDIRLSIGRRRLSVTGFGWWAIAVTLALGVAAINSGSNLLYLSMAMILSMMIVSGIMSEQVLRRIGVERRLPPELYAGTPFPVRYMLKNNKKRVPSFAVSVAEYYPGGGRGAPAFLLKLMPGELLGCEAEEVVDRRGAWSVSGMEVFTRFPFGLFRKSVLIPGAQTKTVYPRLLPLGREAFEGFTRGHGGAVPVRGPGVGAQIRNLRDYQPHEEARLIHWKSSARLSTLMAKEFEAEEGESVTVVLDNLAPPRPSARDGARFEEAVSLAATAVHRLLSELGRPVALLCRDVFIPPGVGRGHYADLMEALAAAGPAPAGGHTPDAALAAGPCVLVLPGRSSGWAAYARSAGLVLEAVGDEV